MIIMRRGIWPPVTAARGWTVIVMRLIDADKFILALMDAALSSVDEDTILDLVDSVPTVDAVPVVHTYWAHLGGDEWICPACGFVITTEGSWDKPTKKYCEDCGARMEGDDDDKTD